MLAAKNSRKRVPARSPAAVTSAGRAGELIGRTSWFIIIALGPQRSLLQFRGGGHRGKKCTSEDEATSTFRRNRLLDLRTSGEGRRFAARFAEVRGDGPVHYEAN